MTCIGVQMLNALKECANFGRGNYYWKRATMAKAVKLGLAEEIPGRQGFQSAFALTEAGRDVLRKHTERADAQS